MTDHSQAALTQRIQAVLDERSDRLDRLVEASGIDPSTDLRFGDFRNFDLRGADLRGYDFTGADLTGAQFDGALIADAKFAGARFEVSAIERAIDFAERETLPYVTCFTPKGDRITLPNGANVIDFAYKIHTELGNSTVGCKINGKFAPLSSPLLDNDEVEVLTSDAQSSPPSAWEALAVTRKARDAVRKATRHAVSEQYAGLGERIFGNLMKRANMKWNETDQQRASTGLGMTEKDIFADIGRGRLKASDLARAMFPAITKKSKAANKRSRSMPIRGINTDLPVEFCADGAIPGDRIVGIVEPGKAVTVYPIQSAALRRHEDHPERWLDVHWDLDPKVKRYFDVRINVSAVDTLETIGLVTTTVGEYSAKVKSLRTEQSIDGRIDMDVELQVFDLKHMSAVFTKLRELNVVIRIERANG